MNKREKIILSAMLVVLLYAAYSFLSMRSSQKTDVAGEKELASVKALSTQVAEDLKKDLLTDTDRCILGRAEAEWATDPFLEKKLSSTPESARGAGGAQGGDLLYSGYLEAGKKRLAVINGMEYQVGEQLEAGGYVLKSIDPERVILEDVGKGGQITLPFSAEIF
jgi:hypothetical protein